MNNIKRKNKGFTIVEVVISISIISICMVGIMDAFILGSFYKKSSEEVTTASFQAQKMLELFLSYPISLTDSEPIYISGVPCPEPYDQYKYSVKITPFEDSNEDSNKLLKITVYVSTPESKLRRIVELSALKSP